MAGQPDDPWSTLVLRVWFEDAPDGFRARIMTRDADGDPVTAAFARRDDLLAALRAWIDEQRR